jgi:hypothetical protein
VAELEAAIAPWLWRGVAAGVAVAALAAIVLARGTAPAEIPRQRAANRDRLVVALLTLLAIALRLLSLTRPLGTDEAATFLYYAARPLVIGLTIYGSPNNHLFHTALAHAAVRIFGDAEWALRLPAFLAGVALVPLTWWTSRRLRCGGGAIAAALVAGAPVLIDYSADARGYTLLCACTLVAAAAMRVVVDHGARRAAIGFAVAAALGFYTVPVMLYPFVFLGAWALLAAKQKRPVLAALAAALLLALALYAPVIAVSGAHTLLANPYVRPLPFATFFAALPRYAAEAWARTMTGVPVAVQLLVAAGAILSRKFNAAGLAAVLLVVVAQRVLPFPRVWLPFLPLLFIAAACAFRWPRLEPVVAVAAALALGIAALANERPRDTGELPNVVPIARDLRLRLRAGDSVVATTPSDLPLAFYLRGAPVDVLHPDVVHGRRIFVVTNRTAGQTLPQTLTAFGIDPRSFAIRRIGDRGVYVLTR